eukprot:TRINITY_DN1444_c2_g2_i1.p1 TRINITY_DN1444_c2_g2~~TRINITY_DN1444_c2_g2_i1.p1  ORF type:complete len:2004 (+),score=493.21 TRINITY_DN1444_c2_g2_i1:66-6014(+)
MRAAAAAAAAVAAAAVAEARPAVRLLVQTSMALQPARGGAGDLCGSAGGDDCSGGFASLAARLRDEAAGAEQAVRILGFQDLWSSPLTRLHPSGPGLNNIIWRRIGADVIAAVSPHAFLADPEGQLQSMAQLSTPPVASNLAVATDFALTQFYGTLAQRTIVQAGRWRVGVLAFLGPHSWAAALPVAELAPGLARALRRGGADLVVAICGGTAADWQGSWRDLAGRGPDAVIGPYCSPPCASSGLELIRGTWLLPAEAAGQGPSRVLGVADFELGSGGVLRPVGGMRTVDLLQAVPARLRDAAFEADTAWQLEQLRQGEASDPVWGVAAAAMPPSSRRPPDGRWDEVCQRDVCPLGALLAAAVRWQVPDADVVWLSGGGMHLGWDAGVLRASAVYRAYPYGGLLCRLTASGPELWAQLARAVGAVQEGGWYNPEHAAAGAFPQTDGLRFTIDPTRPAERRVVQLDARGPAAWEPVSPTRYYSVVTTLHLCGGGHGYTFYPRDRVLLNFSALGALRGYLAAHSPVGPGEAATAVSAGDPRESVVLSASGPQDCPPGERYYPEWGACAPCPAGSAPDNARRMCVSSGGSADSFLVITVAAVLFGIILLSAGAVVCYWRRRGGPAEVEYVGVSARESMAAMWDDGEIAQQTAEAIADMELDEQLEFLRANPNPSRIQQAFVRIIESMKLYRSYMPTGLFVVNDADAANAALRSPRGRSRPRPSRRLSTASWSRRSSAGNELPAGFLRLPQLTSIKTRNALRCIIAQTDGADRNAVVNLMEEQLRKLIRDSDGESAGLLMQCGWEPEGELYEQAQLLVAAAQCEDEGERSTTPPLQLHPDTPPGFKRAQDRTFPVAADSGHGSGLTVQTGDPAPSPNAERTGAFVPGGVEASITLANSPRPGTSPAKKDSPGLEKSHFLGFSVSVFKGNPLASGRIDGPDDASSVEGKNAPNRFGDGVGTPDATVATVSFYPPEYTAPSASEAVASIAIWHNPKAVTYWPGWVIDDLAADCRVCCSGSEHEDVDALYAYTVELHYKSCWAAWRVKPSEGWHQIECMDDRIDGHGRLRVMGTDLVTIGVDTDQRAAVGDQMLVTAFGYTLYNVLGTHVMRYQNLEGGDPDRSPLRDVVLWAPHPDSLTNPESAFCCKPPVAGDAFDSGSDDPDAEPAELVPPPPPGVLEFINCRDFHEYITRRSWESSPYEQSSLRRLREACMSQKNQQRPNKRLCQAATSVFSRQKGTSGSCPPELLQGALPLVYGVKCHTATPTPAQIAHATELSMLKWQGQWFLLALTGAPRCAIVLGNVRRRNEMLYRVDDAMDDQPFQIMNAAMRNQQSGKHDAILTLRLHYRSPRFIGKQPAEAPAVPGPALFIENDPVQARASELQAWWEDDMWQLVEFSTDGKRRGTQQEVESGELEMLGWILPQCRALIWRLENMLRLLPASGSGKTRRKNYRGLAGVSLDRRMYSRGSVVVFGAFTSASDDQGVAGNFAEGSGDAAVFTIYGSTGRCIARWSRFGREKEVLYPPNTLHLVTEALSAEHAAILNKRQLQVYDLRELTQAQAVRHMAKEGALEVSRQHPAALAMAEKCATKAERGDWVGAAGELLAIRTASDTQPGAGAELVPLALIPEDSVAVIALYFDSPSGPEVGDGIDSAVWNSYFELCERRTRESGGRLLASHSGAMLVQVPSSGLRDPEVAARTALGLAVDLKAIEEQIVASLNQDPGTPLAPTSTFGNNFGNNFGVTQHGLGQSRNPLSPSTARIAARSELSSPEPGCSAFDEPQKPSPSGSAASPSPVNDGDPLHSSRGDRNLANATDDAPLRVHIGISLGKVHSGFGGSATQRVEIADGPAVRRARWMAAYSLRFGLREVVLDMTCGAACAREGLIACTLDLVAFHHRQDIRERIVAATRGVDSQVGVALNAPRATALEAAWEAVILAGDEYTEEARRGMQERVLQLPPDCTSHRSAVALRAASRAPAAYCFELDGADAH